MFMMLFLFLFMFMYICLRLCSCDALRCREHALYSHMLADRYRDWSVIVGRLEFQLPSSLMVTSAHGQRLVG